jgi:methylated-DNA-protein-cysteine methyltransferase related protein
MATKKNKKKASGTGKPGLAKKKAVIGRSINTGRNPNPGRSGVTKKNPTGRSRGAAAPSPRRDSGKLSVPNSRVGSRKLSVAKSRGGSGKLSILTPSGRKEDSFFELVHEVARQIPRGRVTSYGAIAAVLGTRMSARMVGWAMNACHSAKKPVPAHRVVNRNGLLSGKHHFDPPSQMEKLLKKEGIKVKDDKIVGFAELFWDPAGELY